MTEFGTVAAEAHRLRAAIRSATVDLLNRQGVGSVDIESVCLATGMTETDFQAQYASVNAVFADILSELMAAHGARMSEELVRRRSLTEIVQTLNHEFLNTVAEFPDEHHALMCLRVAEIMKPDLLTSGGSMMSIHDTLTTNCELWLTEVERMQRITWEKPHAQLAAQQVGAMYGLVLEYLTRRDVTAARRHVDVLSYDLAIRGRRAAKNQQF